MTNMSLPSGLTVERIAEAARRSMLGTDNPGFCLACGAERGDCEPDARRYKCDECGACEVYGAEELVMMLA